MFVLVFHRSYRFSFEKSFGLFQLKISAIQRVACLRCRAKFKAFRKIGNSLVAASLIRLNAVLFYKFHPKKKHLVPAQPTQWAVVPSCNFHRQSPNWGKMRKKMFFGCNEWAE